MKEDAAHDWAAEGAQPSPFGLLLRDPRCNVFCSLFWLPLGWTIASWAPWLGQGAPGVDEVVNFLAPLATSLLVAWNLFASVRLVHRSGHTLSALPLTVVQILLFTLLFYQFACHVGAEQYTWEHSPGIREWIVFAVAHAGRATDVIDGIEAYGLHIQSIRNVGHLTSLALILYHFVITVFFLSLFVEWVNRFKRYLWSDTRLRRVTRWSVGVMAGGLTAAFLVSAFVWPGWRWQDIGWWPVDNALRVVDFLDILEVYQYRFHKLPLFVWESTLTFACRFLLAITLAGFVGRFTAGLRLRWLFGFALDAGELSELRDTHANPRVRAAAQRRLDMLNGLKVELRAEHRRWLTWPVPVAALGVVLVCAGTPWLLPGGERPAESLARIAIEAVPWTAERALSALERMGSGGVDAVPILAERQAELPLERRLPVIATLGYLGPGATEPLEALLDDENSEVRLAAVAALRQVGPAAAPALIRGFGSVYPEVIEACVAGIRQHGNADAQRLADNIDPNNVIEVVRLLDDVDPYWLRRRSPNPAFAKVIDARRAGRAVAAGGSLFLALPDAIDQLRQIGPLASAETAPLEPLLFGEDPALSNQALEAYIAIDKKWHETPTGRKAFTLAVRRMLAGDKATRRRSAEVLRRFAGKEDELAQELIQSPKKGVLAMRELSLDAEEPIRRFAALGLVLLLTAPDAVVQQETAAALAKLDGPAAAAAGESFARRKPLTTRQLLDWCAGKDESLRDLAIGALGDLGGEAQAAVPQLVVLLTHADARVRAAALKSLLKIDPQCHLTVNGALAVDARQAAAAWNELLQSSDVDARCFAAKMTRFTGLASDEVVEKLVALLRPEDSPLQAALVAALAEVDPEGNATATRVRLTQADMRQQLLLLWVRQEDERAQRLGIRLAQRNPASAPAQSVVDELLADLCQERSEPHRAPLLALVGYDPLAIHGAQLAKVANTERAAALLRAWLADSDAAVRKFAVMAAGRLGSGAQGAAGELFSLLAESDADFRRAVWYALMRVDPEGKATGSEVSKQFDGGAIVPLVLGVGDSDSKIRLFATAALASVNSVPASSAGSLALLLQHENPQVRTVVARLLKDVNPDEIAAVEATLYERSLKQAAQSLSAGDRARAGRTLDLCPAVRRGWEWRFLKRQALGSSPKLLRPDKSISAALTFKQIGFTADGATVALAGGGHDHVALYDSATGSLRDSFKASDAPYRDTKPAAKPLPARTKPEAALREEDLAQQREDERSAKASMAAQVKLDKLYEALARAENIANPKAQEAAMRRAQANLDAALEAQAKADTIAAAKADAAGAAKSRPALRERPIPIPKARPVASMNNALAISLDGQRVFVQVEQYLVRLWDVPSAKPVFTLSGAASQMNQAFFCAHGQRLAITQSDAKKGTPQIAILDAKLGTRVRSISPAAYVTTQALSPDGERFAAYFPRSGRANTGIGVWDLTRDEEPIVLDTGTGIAEKCLAFSRTGRLLAAYCLDDHVRIWDTDSGEVAGELSFTLLRGTPGLAFSPDGKLLAVAELSEGLRLYDVGKGVDVLAIPLLGDSELEKVRSRLVDYHNQSCVVAFSPDGNRLAVAAENIVRVWDALP